MGGPETEVEEQNPFSLERIRSLRSILCFPCESVHESHKALYGDLAKKEAAVYCTAILEGICGEVLRRAENLNNPLYRAVLSSRADGCLVLYAGPQFTNFGRFLSAELRPGIKHS